MEAVFHITANEFDESFVNQIKTLLKSEKKLEITISIGEEQSKGILRKETREEYFSRLDKSIDNFKKGHGVTFGTEEFEDFSKQLLNEP